MKIKFTKFVWDGLEYVLKEPLNGNIKYDGVMWTCEVPFFGLFSHSLHKEEAVNDINEDFYCQYNGLIEEKDDKLTLDAIELRDRLRDGIAEIRETEKQYHEEE